MISLINASAFRSDKGGSQTLSSEDCQKYLAKYASSKIRVWAYRCSRSRLVLRIDRPSGKRLAPIDLVFVGLSDIRCPVHWVLGALEVRLAADGEDTVFAVPSAGVSVSASDFTIVIQDEYPQRVWELES